MAKKIGRPVGSKGKNPAKTHKTLRLGQKTHKLLDQLTSITKYSEAECLEMCIQVAGPSLIRRYLEDHKSEVG